jgi:DNA-binding IclR family transcriptional regulator
VADIKILTNNTYRVLSYLFDKKDRNNLVVVTQNEVSKDLDLNKTTVNTIMRNLKENGYITQDENHVGRYSLTDAGVKTVSLFRKSEK